MADFAQIVLFVLVVSHINDDVVSHINDDAPESPQVLQSTADLFLNKTVTEY